MRKSHNHRLAAPHFDWPLLIASYALALYGVLAITIANYNPNLGSNRSFQQLVMDANNGRLQFTFVIVSIIAVSIVVNVKYTIIGRLSPLIYGVNVLLLGFVLTTSKINGMAGWFRFMNRTFQPSEIAKLAVIITLSKALSKHHPKAIRGLKDLIYISFVYVAVPAVLILAQPDIGTLMVVCVIYAFSIFVAGLDYKWIFLLISAAATVITPVIFYLKATNNFRWLRLAAFLNPESDPTGSSYQIVNSMVTIGSGGIDGKGMWAEGTLTHLNYVPENHTDFIFSVIGETLGFKGSILLLALYLFVILRMLMLSYYTNDRFGRLIIVGVMAMLLFHVVENVGMCIGVMPITGIPLPFISYGGTNLVTNMAGIALVLNVTKFKSSVDLQASNDS